MKKKIKVLSIFASAVLATSLLAGCGTKDKKDGAKSDNKKIGMVVSTLNNPFFVSMKEGAEAKAKAMGYELVVLNSQDSADTERSNVEDLVQQGVGAIIINPTDSDAVANAVQVANDNEIPVITVDRKSNGGEVASHIESDNVKGGEMAAKFILDNLKDSAEIKTVELQGVPGASATRDRGQGFHNIVDKDKKVNLIAKQSADFDRQKGLTVMENIIQAKPQIDAIFAHNDEMALGAVKALKAAKKKSIIIGFDGNEDAINAVKSGDMTATVAQQPKLMGEISVENAVKASKGEKVDKLKAVELKLVTKENAK
ncbi:ribose ABC transporter substrate-binding protein RbsB [Haloimpatiens sp. FM7315]|uniref:ribose ABC transporter substrate-binding protein RbsB n=1 Tax=Haloimpatiens sp. FM7315 TaxID=3298609 RepID=UPI0035A2F8C2